MWPLNKIWNVDCKFTHRWKRNASSLNGLRACGEKWIFYYNYFQSSHWLDTNEPRNTCRKQFFFQKKVILTPVCVSTRHFRKVVKLLMQRNSILRWIQCIKNNYPKMTLIALQDSSLPAALPKLYTNRLSSFSEFGAFFDIKIVYQLKRPPKTPFRSFADSEQWTSM